MTKKQELRDISCLDGCMPANPGLGVHWGFSELGFFRKMYFPEGLVTPSRVVNTASEKHFFHNTQNIMNWISEPEGTLGDHLIQAHFTDEEFGSSSQSHAETPVAEPGSPSPCPLHVLLYHTASYISVSVLVATHTLPFLPTSQSPS